jgi:imidazolonepropionase-like amidohydrolase
MVEANGTTPRLLLANGVTTARLAGADRPFLELAIRRWIQDGRIAGPELFLTAPFVSEPFESLVRYRFVVLHDLTSEQEGREFVRYWASAGFDAIKVYRGMRAEMLRVLVDEARRNGIYVLGHIQRVTCLEAARAGMRSIEHGLSICTDDLKDAEGRAVRDPQSDVVRQRFAELIRLGVTITETPVDLRPLTGEELDVLHVGARAEYDRLSANGDLGPGVLTVNEEQAPAGMTVAFFRAGGRVMLGADSSGVPRIPGFANLRALRLLYTAYGFDPLEAIRIATLEGARFLGIEGRTGSVEAGKEADLVVLRGDPTIRFADVENIELVFANGALFYPEQLLDEVRGQHLRQN